MLIRKPAYFHTFRCIANQCPDSCCKGWEVEVDADAAKLYRALPGPLGDRLRSVLRDDPQWGTVMTIEDGRCPMWRTDGLCRIQVELGHDALCKTCRDFPRLTHDYGNFVEYGLELSCPEAARLILTASDPSVVTEEIPGGDAPDYDQEAMEHLLKSRKTALAIIADTKYSIPEMLVLFYYFVHQAQAPLDGETPPDFLPERILESARQLAVSEDFPAVLDFFARLEILTPEWRSRLANPLSPTSWSDSYRNLARYFVERYWLQAVSDYDLVSRGKMILLSCLVIHHLGGDLIATAQLYSKEIENNTDNLDALLDAAYAHPALTDDKLLELLLSF